MFCCWTKPEHGYCQHLAKRRPLVLGALGAQYGGGQQGFQIQAAGKRPDMSTLRLGACREWMRYYAALEDSSCRLAFLAHAWQLNQISMPPVRERRGELVLAALMAAPSAFGSLPQRSVG